MRKQIHYYSETFKRQVVFEVLSGSITKEGARKKYGLHGKSMVLNWMRKFAVSEARQLATARSAMKNNLDTDPSSLQKRIRELERALSDAQLKSEGYEKMIEIAERELKISIRKKSSTKQSEK